MHRAAFLTFPFPGDKECLEIHSHSLAAAGGHQKGPPWAEERDEVVLGGGLRGQQDCGAVVGAGKAPSLQLPGCSPCELCSAPSFPPHRSSRAEGRKGEFGGEGQDPIFHPPSKFRLPTAPWLSWNSLSVGTGPNPKKPNDTSTFPMSILDGRCHPHLWLEALLPS